MYVYNILFIGGTTEGILSVLNKYGRALSLWDEGATFFKHMGAYNSSEVNDLLLNTQLSKYEIQLSEYREAYNTSMLIFMQHRLLFLHFCKNP